MGKAGRLHVQQLQLAAVCTDLYNLLWSCELLSDQPTAAPDQPAPVNVVILNKDSGLF